MSKITFLYVVFFCLVSNSIFAQPKLSKSDLIKLDFSILAEKKKKIQSKATVEMEAYSQLLKEANKTLNYGPVSVMEKTDLPPSGDKHDYMSIAPYWWPDSTKPDGLPYIRKDGEVNPEVRNYPDKEYLPKLCYNVNLLSLAYYFSGDDKYAAHAAKLLQVWFLDTATRMNPNLNYAQAIKGKTDGRGAGLIDARHFIYVVDAISLLKDSKSWSAQQQKGMIRWFSDFLSWMQTSEVGKDEMDAKNNHGVWYDAQSLAYAQFVGRNGLANEIVQRAAERLDRQMDDKGFFPLELERTTSLHYSVFMLNAFTVIAQCAERTNTDFWKLTTTSGKSLQKGFDAILPFITKEKPWTGNQIKAFGFSDAIPVLLRCGAKYDCKKCMSAIREIGGENHQKLLINLL